MTLRIRFLTGARVRLGVSSEFWLTLTGDVRDVFFLGPPVAAREHRAYAYRWRSQLALFGDLGRILEYSGHRCDGASSSARSFDLYVGPFVARKTVFSVADRLLRLHRAVTLRGRI